MRSQHGYHVESLTCLTAEANNWYKFTVRYTVMSSHVCLWVCWCICRAADELQNEAKSHMLNHENIVVLFAMIFEPGHYGVVLEFVPDGCLQDFIYRRQVFNCIHYISLLCIYDHMCTTQFQLLVALYYPMPYLLNSASCALGVCVWISLCHAPVVHSVDWYWSWGVGKQRFPKIWIGWETNVDVRSATSTHRRCCVYTRAFGSSLASQTLQSIIWLKLHCIYIMPGLRTANILMLHEICHALLLFSGWQYILIEIMF